MIPYAPGSRPLSAPVGAVGAVGVLSGIRLEQRRLENVVEDLDPLKTPERVLTLLEDALLSLREAGDHLRRHVRTLEHECSSSCGCHEWNDLSRRLEHMPLTGYVR